MSETRCIVILLDDEPRCRCGCSPQEYVLATRTAFTDREVAQGYADACAESRKAIVVECPRGVDFRHLEPTTPEPKQVQKSGGICKKCGGFTTYTRQNTHGLCLKCELEAAK